MLTWAYCPGQYNYFRDIVHFDSTQLKPKILYFHFKHCPPCKKMDKEVFSDSLFVQSLSEKYALFSVYEYGKYELAIRKIYNNVTNPEFIVLSKNNEILHRFVGFYDKHDFVEELDMAYTDNALSKLEEQYPSNKDDYKFLNKYFHAKEQAFQLDSALIFEYLDAYRGDKFAEDYIYDVAQYGYNRCKIYIKYGSKYYDLLKQVYDMNLYPEIREKLRVRLLFTLNSYAYENTEDINKFIHTMESLENGEHNILGDIYSDRNCAIIIYKYPSFYFKYEATTDSLNKAQVLTNYLAKIVDDAQALNSTAWQIYTDELQYPAEVGINIAETALKIKKEYNYIDTYAALLYKSGRFDDAQKQAESAIVLAKEKGIDYTETQQLLTKISEAKK